MRDEPDELWLGEVWSSEEDARLMAVAPELLTLLKRLCEWDHLDAAGDGPYWRTELERLIDKAEGRA